MRKRTDKKMKTAIGLLLLIFMLIVQPYETHAANASATFGSQTYEQESGEEFPIGLYLRGEEIKCTLCQGHYDFSFSDFYFIFVCCVEASK